MGGIKHDKEKNRVDLLPIEALEETAKVLTFGARKYAAHNWRKGFLYSRLIGATLRHLFAFIRGEDLDTETGLHHLAHAMCELSFLLTQCLNKTGKDDRYKGKKK